MIADIVNNQDIILTNITPWEEEIVNQHFSLTVPTYGKPDFTSGGGWDGTYRKYNKNKRRLARPYLGELRSMAFSKNVPINVRDMRDPSTAERIDPADINENMLPGITLKSFQVEAIRSVVNAECGIFDISTGGGKSEIIAAICKCIKCHTVIITEARVVVDQLKQRLMLRDICDEPGMFYAGKKPTGELVIIGTIQSLVIPQKSPKRPEKKDYESDEDAKYKRDLAKYEQRIVAFKSRVKNAKNLHKIISQCDMILVDECDVAVSDTWKKLFRFWFKGRYRFGFSGTPKDPNRPVEWLTLQEHLGSIIYRQDRKEVLETGLTVPLEYYMVPIGMSGDRKDSSAYDIASEDFIYHNEKLHDLIRDICNAYPGKGKLILVDRNDLGEALLEKIEGSRFYHGNTKKSKRAEMISDFEERKYEVMIGGKNVRRGLDLKGGCEILIIATGGKMLSEFDQRLGRARRLNKDGKAKVFDFMFLCNKYLYSHSRDRLRAVVNMGYECNVLFPLGAIKAADFIRRQYKIPKSFSNTYEDVDADALSGVITPSSVA